mgnify:FL=1
MSALKITLILLAVSVAVNALDASNFTCIGNPYFTPAYNPNASQPGETDLSVLSQWGVTYDVSTGIYNLSNYSYLPACKQLKQTGSCCAPDYINRTVEAYINLFNATTEATLKIFKHRVEKLAAYAKIYGKIFGTFVDVISHGHEIVFKIVRNVNKILADGNTLLQLMTMMTDTNSSDILSMLASGKVDASNLNPFQLANATYQLVNIVAGQAGISKNVIAGFFGSVRALENTLGSLPKNLFASFDAFPTVEPALISDGLNKWGSIFLNLMNRVNNVTLSVNLPSFKRRLRLLDSSSQTLTIPLPHLVDPRNIEAVFKALNDATKNAPNATDFFNILLKNATEIYTTINNTWTSNINSLDDVKVGGSWDEVKKFIVKIATYIFEDSLQKVITVANNKKQCFKVVFQYQGYIGCLACDASAMALGKIQVNETTNTFSPVVSSAFGSYVKGNCTEYIKDLLYINSYLQGMKAMKTAYDVDVESRQKPDSIDTDISKPINGSNTTIDSQLDIPCSLADPECKWIQNNVVDNVGPTIGFLCDYDTDDCELLGKLMEMRGPQFKKNGNATPQKRMLGEDTTSNGGVVYSDTAEDEVTTTEVGFTTEPNYTVSSNDTSNITVDNSTDTSTPAANTTNNTNTTKSALKGLICIPLILATIAAFLF